jgi:putative ABC transport system permease protein
MYASEQRLNSMLVVFSGLAIFIACMGIFGLAAFTAEKRTKEIGIRKVLGASAQGIIGILFKGFTRWILIANLIAWPIAFYAMKRWLENYAFRVNLGFSVFLVSGGIVFLIACLTVSYQSIKAAVANPIDALRYE